MNERIKLVRKTMDLTMREFGEKIGISASSIAHLESGENNPSEQTIRAICSQFNVRRDWLETGEGPMQLPPDEGDELVDAVMQGENEFMKSVFRSFARAATTDDWKALQRIYLDIARNYPPNTEKDPDQA